MPGEQVWSARYDMASTPWDLGEPHPELVRRLSNDPAWRSTIHRTAYVPGCGSGHDAAALAASGWEVTAVDFAPAVESVLRRRLEPLGAQVHIGDALAHRSSQRFGLIFDHTFFCAIDPEGRDTFGVMVDRLLDEDGIFVSVVYPLGKPQPDGGPPWGIDVDMISAALGSGFELVSAEPPATVPGRRWPHSLAEWRRR